MRCDADVMRYKIRSIFTATQCIGIVGCIREKQQAGVRADTLEDGTTTTNTGMEQG